MTRTPKKHTASERPALGLLWRFDQGMWYRFSTLLLSGDRIPLHPSDFCYLLETRPVALTRSAGMVVKFGERRVSLSVEAGACWAQALRSRVAVPVHDHRLACTTLGDGWDLVFCVVCGSEW